MFDKQTAPKELINSPHYHSHSHSSEAFPTFPSFSLFPSLTCFCLTLPFRRPSHLPVCFAPLHRLKTRHAVRFLIHHSSSAPLSTSPSLPRSHLLGQCLSSNVTSVSFSAEIKCAGGEAIKENFELAQLQALFPHPPLHYS